MAADWIGMEPVHLLDGNHGLAAPASEAGVPAHGQRGVAALRLAEPAAGNGGVKAADDERRPHAAATAMTNRVQRGGFVIAPRVIQPRAAESCHPKPNRAVVAAAEEPEAPLVQQGHNLSGG